MRIARRINNKRNERPITMFRQKHFSNKGTYHILSNRYIHRMKAEFGANIKFDFGTKLNKLESKTWFHEIQQTFQKGEYCQFN